MRDAKPLASLSPALLARKGGARPAMRHQLQPLRHNAETTARNIDDDDLGWNDLGHTDEVTAEVVPLNGVVRTKAVTPEVVRQQETIAERLSHPGTRRSALAEGRRAAFTLRLDAERHLKLRLACTIDNRSAQQMLTEALDRLLAETPEVTALAQQIRKRK